MNRSEAYEIKVLTARSRRPVWFGETKRFANGIYSQSQALSRPFVK